MRADEMCARSQSDRFSKPAAEEWKKLSTEEKRAWALKVGPK